MLRDGFLFSLAVKKCHNLIIFSSHTLRSAALSMQNNGYLCIWEKEREREREREGEREREKLRLHASDHKP